LALDEEFFQFDDVLARFILERMVRFGALDAKNWLLNSRDFSPS